LEGHTSRSDFGCLLGGERQLEDFKSVCIPKIKLPERAAVRGGSDLDEPRFTVIQGGGQPQPATAGRCGAHHHARIVNYTAAQEKIWAPAYGLANAFVDYRTKLWNRKINTTVRLNVANLLNNRDHIRATTDATGTIITGYSFQDPRLFTLSVDFGF
jgi:hypothetical protein